MTLSILTWLSIVCAVVGTLLWLAMHWRAIIALRRLPSLADEPAVEPERWPRLSIVVAACNEEETIATAARTLLAQDYPDLEIVLVDDRSSDRTGELMDALAASDPRVRVKHIEQLPEGWLGKVHALERGTEIATGEWLLYTDADVHLSPRCLRRAVATAIANEFDHLPVMPRVQCNGVAQEATVSNFVLGYLSAVQIDKLADPESEAFAGVGAFNLVRADALRRSEGFAWLRMEVVDDVGLGFALKRAGARTGLALGKDDVAIEWYRSLPDMVRGLEKNCFGLFGGYRIGRTLVTLALFLLTFLGPALAFLTPARSYLWPLGAVAVATLPLYAYIVSHHLGQRFAASLLHPLGAWVVGYTALRSMVTILRRRGIVWRGTFYPLPALVAGRRLKF